MDTAELQRHLKREPFVPFRVELDDGTRHHITRPDGLRLMGHEVFVMKDSGCEATARFHPSRVSGVNPVPDLIPPNGRGTQYPSPPQSGGSNAMTSKQIQDHLNRRLPHVQLRFHLTDGMTYDVTDNATASVREYQLVIGVDPDPDGLPRRSVYIDPHHVARVETLVQSTPGATQQERP